MARAIHIVYNRTAATAAVFSFEEDIFHEYTCGCGGTSCRQGRDESATWKCCGIGYIRSCRG